MSERFTEPSDSPSLLGYVWAYRFRFTKGIGLTLLRALVISPLPFLFRLIIDEHVKSANYAGILSVGLIFSGLLCLFYFFAICAARFFAVVVARMVMELRGRIFHRLQILSFGYLDEVQTGKLISKYAFDTQKIEMAITPIMRELLPGTMVSLGMIIVLSIFNWQLMLIVFLLIPIYGISRLVFYGKMKQSQRETRVAHEGMTGQASEYISAIRLIRGLGQEKLAREVMDESSSTFAISRAEQSSVNSAFQAFAYVSREFISLVVVGGGSVLVIAGQMSYGTLVAFLVALPIILSPVQLFVSFSQQYFLGRESYRSIKELLDSPLVEKWRGTLKIPDMRGDIRFEHVSFTYGEDRPDAVRDINLHIPAGRHYAFVGPSGSGKSTLANLVLGLYAPSSGQILIDDVPQAAFSMRWFRRTSAIVMQESILLSGSISDNIRFARPNAGDEEVRQAARFANAEEFILQLPNGYNTPVGERGVSLSGGQRQRISIARALLRNPRVLILDEATSALDYESERLVQEALDHLTEGRTVITIAHRLSTVKNVDVVVVLSKGEIVETGSFSELSKREGYLSELLTASAVS